METIDLTSETYWNEPGIDLRLNPKRRYETEGLIEAVTESTGVDAAVVLATSGSQGAAKFVVLEKRALLASARAVNEHCGLSSEDIWLNCLPTFHVGGLGIVARAVLSGSKVGTLPWDAWEKDGRVFVEACNRFGATVTSITPVHLFDLVRAQVQCPETLRGVFVGGGSLSQDLGEWAWELGWPLWMTYGMTETCSQVATSVSGDREWLPILPNWETKLNRDTGILSLRGEALFSGYLHRETTLSAWQFDSAKDSGAWFVTSDILSRKDGKLKFIGRSDDLVKVLGELVSLSQIENRLVASGLKSAVIAIPHARRGHELIAFLEGGAAEKKQGVRTNSEQSDLEKISRFVLLKRLPLSGPGKIDRAELRRFTLD